METPEHQEWRSRQSISWTATWQVAVTAGIFTFILSGGAPWSTAGTMNAVMGRHFPIGFIPLLVGHFLVAFIYMTVIAFCVYRLPLFPALIAGPAIGLGLYGVNRLLFIGVPSLSPFPEFRVFFTHIIFSLIAAVAYKGASIPRPLQSD